MTEFVTQDEFKTYKESVAVPRDNVESALDGALGQHVASGNQFLYANTQLLKWDPSWFTVNERGLSVLGVEVFRFPGLHALENSAFSSAERRRRRDEQESERVQEGLDRLRAITEEDEGRAAAGPGSERRLTDVEEHVRKNTLDIQKRAPISSVDAVSKKLKNANTRINGVQQRGAATRRTVGLHATTIRGLLRNQQAAARASRRGDITPRAGSAENRGRRHREEARALRQVETALRNVENEARRLERAL